MAESSGDLVVSGPLGATVRSRIRPSTRRACPAVNASSHGYDNHHAVTARHRRRRLQWSGLAQGLHVVIVAVNDGTDDGALLARVDGAQLIRQRVARYGNGSSQGWPAAVRACRAAVPAGRWLARRPRRRPRPRLAPAAPAMDTPGHGDGLGYGDGMAR